jgi:hypothetical protein
MPFEYTESTTQSTLILYRMPNKQLKFSGMIRLSFQDGTSTLRLTASIDNTRKFDEIQIVEPPAGDATELALTHYNADYGLAIT